MNAKIIITGLSETEEAAREILKHVEAIKKIQAQAAWNSIVVEAQFCEGKAASCN